MGANAQTTVPTFTASQVLTADQQNQSARTGVPVFATTGTRDAAFGGAGEKTLAEGQLCYVEGTGFQTYNGTAWVTWGTAPSSGALVYLTNVSFTAQTTVAFANSIFSSTYDFYLVQLQATADATTKTMSLQVRDNSGTKSGNSYYGSWTGLAQNGAGGSATANPSTSFPMSTVVNDNYATYAITVSHPASATKKTTWHGTATTLVTAAGLGYTVFGGTYYVDEAHTGLVFTFSGATTGSYRVYGYANS